MSLTGVFLFPSGSWKGEQNSIYNFQIMTPPAIVWLELVVLQKVWDFKLLKCGKAWCVQDLMRLGLQLMATFISLIVYNDIQSVLLSVFLIVLKRVLGSSCWFKMNMRIQYGCIPKIHTIRPDTFFDKIKFYVK